MSVYRTEGNEEPLLPVSRSSDSLPTHVASSTKHGAVSKDQLQQYLHWEQHPFIRHLLCFPGMKERLLADPAFLAKLAVEAGMGTVTKVIAELQKRPEKFLAELDLVLANVIMSLISDIMLIWIPAPRAILGGGQSSPTPTKRQKHEQGRCLGPVYHFWSACPANAFQESRSSGEQYTMLQRWGSILKNGVLLFAVGSLSSVLGVLLTDLLLFIRNMLNQDLSADSTSQQVMGISIAHGVYMATSGNFRYQVIGGLIEERGINKVFAQRQTLSGVLVFVIRTVNTYIGSAQWVDFLRFLGLQEA